VSVKLYSVYFAAHCMVHGLLVTARARLNISVNVRILFAAFWKRTVNADSTLTESRRSIWRVFSGDQDKSF